jgi:hypothetical protein
MTMDAKRNDPCPCGSGRKYKKCHGMMEAEKKKIVRSYSVTDSKNPIISVAQKIIEAIESPPQPVAPSNFPASKASTKEAETPELAAPRTFTAGQV